MKVLLMRPYSSMVKAPPPLGLLYVASFIRNKNHEVRVLDARVKRSSDKDIARYLTEYRPEVVGISLLSVEAEAGHHLARIVKNLLPSCKVILGGPYPTSEPEDILRNECVDAGVVGEGEESFSELLNELSDGGIIPRLPGVISRDHGEQGFVMRTPIKDVDSIPFPAYDLVDLKDYFRRTTGFSQNVFQVKKRSLPMFTSRGCPYQCTYCHTIFGKAFRARSPENIIEEIRWLRKTYGVEEIDISDDTFNIKSDRVLRLCECLTNDSGILISFPNGIRADLMDRNLIRALKSAGTFRISYGIESGSPRIQKNMKKFLNLEKAAEVVRWTAEEGVITGGFFMLGFPDETREEMEETVNFACQNPFHFASFFYVIPFPRTFIYNEAIRRGYTPEEIKAGLHSHLIGYHKPWINLSSIDDRDFMKIKRRATRKFYLSTNRIRRIIQAFSRHHVPLQNLSSNASVVLRIILRRSVVD